MRGAVRSRRLNLRRFRRFNMPESITEERGSSQLIPFPAEVPPLEKVGVGEVRILDFRFGFWIRI
jgi:hypothetical protein